MSLDVYLTFPQSINEGAGVFIHDVDTVREITRAEWDAAFPNTKPLIWSRKAGDNLYSANITHNLGKMADAAGVYGILWRPDENGITYAHQLIEPLTAGLERLRSEPEHFKQFNPPNGWGDYDILVAFVRMYLEACTKYPHAEVSVWR